MSKQDSTVSAMQRMFAASIAIIDQWVHMKRNRPPSVEQVRAETQKLDRCMRELHEATNACADEIDRLLPDPPS